MRLSVPAEGIRGGGVVLRFPVLADVDAILPAFVDPELREAGNLPAFDREALVASLEEMPTLAEMGRLLALAALDAETGEVVGGGTLHHLDTETPETTRLTLIGTKTTEKGITVLTFDVAPARECRAARQGSDRSTGLTPIGHGHDGNAVVGSRVGAEARRARNAAGSAGPDRGQYGSSSSGDQQ